MQDTCFDDNLNTKMNLDIIDQIIFDLQEIRGQISNEFDDFSY